MAELTEQELEKVRTLLSAYDNGQTINDLPASDDSIQDKTIEVYNEKSGESEKMDLRSAVRLANSPSCGRIWNEELATPLAASWFGSKEMLRNLNDVLGLGCYLVKNDHTRRKLDRTNHYKYENGETAKLDGSEGHYQWGWGKKWYYATYKIGPLRYEEISLSPIVGQYNYEIPIASMSAAGFACMERSTNTLVSYVNDDANYRGGNNTASWDDTYRSLLGMPVTSITNSTALTAAKRNGEGWINGSVRMSWAVATLFGIIFGTHNIQAAHNPDKDANGFYQGGFGAGVTSFNGDKWNAHNSYNPFIPTSAGIELGDSCGLIPFELKNEEDETIYTCNIPVFFGLKNPHAYLWRLQGDELGRANEDTSITHLIAPSVYGTWSVTDGTGMDAFSTSPTNISSYIKRISYDNCELWPTQTGASESTYFCDYFWNTSGVTSGFRLVLRGCSASAGAHSGLFGVYVNVAVTYSPADLGSPLCEFAEDWALVPRYAQAA